MGITQQIWFWLKNGNLPEQINGTINNIALTDDNTFGSPSQLVKLFSIPRTIYRKKVIYGSG